MMMKKLLVLALVLSVATMANAALTLTISGPTELLAGASATYTVGYSGAAILSSDNDIVADFGTVGGGVILTANRDSALDVIQISPVTSNYQIAITNDILGTDMGAPLFSFVFTAPATVPAGNYAHLALLDNGATCDLQWNVITDAVMPNAAVHITPEPITMALLGLGGLFLRRRSK
jgi:hypothetical protein